jgi:spermidine/putrescine transport system substrate-binding protein
MTDVLTRQELLRRGVLGGAALTIPGILAACGGSSSGGSAAGTSTAAAAGSQKLPKTLTWSNWPLYIDVDEKTKTRPTLVAFEKRYGVKVRYIEDINDNDSYFGKIEGPLSQGQSIHRDVIVMTDYSGLPSRLIELGWLEKLDKAAIPNMKNLIANQRHPGWDPNRDYSLPWQSGFTGIGYDPDKVGGELTSVDKLLTDPKLKGKVTLLNDLPDAIGIVMLANGDDPSHVTDASFDRAYKRIKKAVDSGQIRQFTGNDYAPLLAKGDVWAAMAWSGDLVQLKADHPGLKWNLPSTGGIVWTDNMLIPKGGNVYGASVLMNWYYQPSIMAKVEDYVNYIPPVAGTNQALAKLDPTTAHNPLIIPPASVLANVHQFDAKAVNNQKYKRKFQALLAG